MIPAGPLDTRGFWNVLTFSKEGEGLRGFSRLNLLLNMLKEKPDNQLPVQLKKTSPQLRVK
jgi:hypothetical protein